MTNQIVSKELLQVISSSGRRCYLSPFDTTFAARKRVNNVMSQDFYQIDLSRLLNDYAILEFCFMWPSIQTRNWLSCCIMHSKRVLNRWRIK